MFHSVTLTNKTFKSYTNIYSTRTFNEQYNVSYRSYLSTLSLGLCAFIPVYTVTRPMCGLTCLHCHTATLIVFFSSQILLYSLVYTQEEVLSLCCIYTILESNSSVYSVYGYQTALKNQTMLWCVISLRRSAENLHGTERPMKVTERNYHQLERSLLS